MLNEFFDRDVDGCAVSTHLKVASRMLPGCEVGFDDVNIRVGLRKDVALAGGEDEGLLGGGNIAAVWKGGSDR